MLYVSRGCIEADLALSHAPHRVCLVQQQASPLHVASSCRQIDAVESLLNHGADLEAKNIHQATPVHLGSIVMLVFGQRQKPGLDLFSLFIPKACEMGAVDIVEMLLDRGANIECRNKVRPHAWVCCE